MNVEKNVAIKVGIKMLVGLTEPSMARSAIFRGCAETTLYLIALYFGSVQVRNTRYAVTGGLIADAAGIAGGIFAGYLFFH